MLLLFRDKKIIILNRNVEFESNYWQNNNNILACYSVITSTTSTYVNVIIIEYILTYKDHILFDMFSNMCS